MTNDEEDGLQTACGIFGCVATKWPTELDVAHVICMGLTALQHRGQEGAGIVTSHGDGGPLQAHKGLGLVSQAFAARDLDRLKGNLGVGHTRYSTFGGLDRVNVQPFVVQTEFGPFASAHNGELVNAVELRAEIMSKGVGLSTLSDSELITQVLCMPPTEDESNGPNWPARIKNVMKRTKIAYSLLIMVGDTIYAVRDPYGNRPLCLGKLVPSPGSEGRRASRADGCAETESDGEVLGEDDCDGYVVSSESCAFLCVAARLIREVDPGEIVEITKNGCKSLCVIPRDGAKCPSLCIFEYVYFARPDSVLDGQTVYSARKECGRQLAIHAPAVADLVSCVPESATAAALGFSEHSKIPYVEVLCKNRYVGRTFIQPSTKLRQLAVLKKFGPLTENFRGKRIVLVDDSIVRGNTIGAIIKLLKTAGASEVHIRVASPPLRHPCFMGINIPTKEELIANKYEADELAQLLGADSLVYLSVENLTYAVRKHANVNGKATGQCTACLTGNYPVLLPKRLQW